MKLQIFFYFHLMNMRLHYEYEITLLLREEDVVCIHSRGFIYLFINNVYFSKMYTCIKLFGKKALSSIVRVYNLCC